MPLNDSPQFVATGTIAPSRFVMIDTNGNFGVQQATANAKIIGISQVGADFPPGVCSGSVNAAVSGESIQIFALGDVCLLQAASSAGFTAGDYLEADLNGAGITSSSSGHHVGAQALQTVNASEFGLVQIMIFDL